MDLEEWSNPDDILFCAACFIGCGGRFEGDFFHCELPWFIKSQNLHINALELLTIVVAVKMWGFALKGKKIVVNCDNYTSCRVHNIGFSRVLFSEICYYAAINEFQIKANLLTSSENRLADYLSRWTLNKSHYSQLFHDLVADMTVTEHIVHESLFSFTHNWWRGFLDKGAESGYFSLYVFNEFSPLQALIFFIFYMFQSVSVKPYVKRLNKPWNLKCWEYV